MQKIVIVPISKTRMDGQTLIFIPQKTNNILRFNLTTYCLQHLAIFFQIRRLQQIMWKNKDIILFGKIFQSPVQQFF